MTKKEEDIDLGKPSEPEVIAEAVPTGQGNEPPIPAGHSRFYCSKCHTVRPSRNAFSKRQQQLLLLLLRTDLHDALAIPLLAHSLVFSRFFTGYFFGSRTTFRIRPRPGDARIA